MAADPRENTARGTLFAAIVIPVAAALGLAPVPLDVQWLYWVVVVVSLPWLARLLYTTGSGGYLASGKRRVVAVTIVALVLAAAGSALTVAYQVYRSVGGAGGPLDPAFLRVLVNSLSTTQYFGYGTVEDFIFTLVSATVLGGASLAIALASAPRPPLQRATPN